MFKSNLSPLNPAKDKFQNNNYPQSSNDLQNMSNHHQAAYQYKGIYTANTHYKPEMGPSSSNYNPPLSPLSPNITKNPMSPTAKIKMFSNTLTLNKKPSQNTNPTVQNNTQEPQPKMFNKMGVKNLTLNLNESIDLKCDQVLQVNQEYRKQTPQQPVKQNGYGKRTGAKIPILNLESQIDDLKCDEVLEIKKNDHDESKRNLRFNNVPNLNSHANNTNSHHQGLSNHDLENNFTYTNMGNKNYQYQTISNGDKTASQAPLTPGYDKKKTNPLITMRKNTDRQPTNNSNPSSHTPQHQKPRSFTNIVSPHIPSKHAYQQNEQQHQSLNRSNPSVSQTSTAQKRFEEMKKLFERTSILLEAYKKEVDQTKEKLNEVQDKNSFLEKENMQLRKCLYEEGSSSGRNYHVNNYPLTPGANRYQGIK